MGSLPATGFWAVASPGGKGSGSGLECCFYAHTAPAGCGRTGSQTVSLSCSHCNHKTYENAYGWKKIDIKNHTHYTPETCS